MTPTLADKTVLLVEDNPGDARLITESLKDAGSSARLIAVEMLEDALERLATDRIDAVILDLGLPDSSGLETFERLQQAAPTVATVILSGDSDARTATQAVQNGAQDFLVKGRADGETLVRSIRYAIERKKADAEIADSEEKFRYVFDQSVIAKSLTDAATGEVVVNQAFCDMLGYTREELSDGTTWAELTYPDDVAESTRQMDLLRSGEAHEVRFQKRYVAKDGRLVWVDLSSSLRRDAVGTPLYFITAMVDITARKKAEEDLLASEERLRHSLEVSEAFAEFTRVLVAVRQPLEDIAHLALDYALSLTLSEHGYVTRIDPRSKANVILASTSMMPSGATPAGAGPQMAQNGHAYAHLWGVSLNTGLPFLTNSPAAETASTGVPEGHAKLTSYLSVPVITGAGLVGQIAVANAVDGYSNEDVVVLERLASLYAGALVRGEEHELLRQSELDLRSAQAIARMGSFSVDLATDAWESSPTLDQILGIGESHPRTMEAWFDLVHEDDRDMVRRHVGEVLAGHTPLDIEYRSLRPRDGRTIWVHSLGTLEMGNGTPSRLLGSTQDVTTRHEAEQQILATSERLQRMIKQVAEVMGSITESRDPYTQGHQVRVAAISHVIGVEMGLPDDDLEGLQMAALVHDIGKLAIPSEILSKPGQLTDVEMRLIREHPVMGHTILERVDFPWPIADIVMQHHERCDGSGYPAGLHEPGTHPLARILAVADVLEAMSSHRPYRPSLGAAAAMAEITGHPDKYCADVVRAAVALYERAELGI